MKIKQSIYQKLKDLVLEGEEVEESNSRSGITSRIIGSIFITLSGLVLYLDKVFEYYNIEFLIPNKFHETGLNFTGFLWILAQTISPLLIILGSILRPYYFSYLIPVYCYILQLYFILFDYQIVDNHYITFYSLGTFILIVLVFHGIKELLYYMFRRKISKIKNQINQKYNK
ncbi:hypothetical protein [Ascidiimonas aurantiaca]|uniref:hypothetical protein n=1 Tax=Ascidiimonas aurantiaca TaxID=1685432 RepID=UPI0030EEB8B2